MSILELTRTEVPEVRPRARALVFEDPLSRELLRRIEQVAPTKATVLITGETGTGKELVARHVHSLSARSDTRFVAVNCGALTPSLMESELFGHEKGAFTGAFTTKPGWFEDANGGTLFLDEIGDLPLGAQVKLLRVLQEEEVVRVGARRPIPTDVRLIAATNANLEEAVASGRFRDDLYYRLRVAHVGIAPLRERPADVLPLALHFLASYAARCRIDRPVLSDEVVAALRAHPWPGNIRELENTMHRAILVVREGVVRVDDLHLTSAPSNRPPAIPARAADADPWEALHLALVALFNDEATDLHQRIEDRIYRAAYEHSDRNQLAAARLLGVSRNVVRARLLRCGILASGASTPGEAPTAPPTMQAPSATRATSVRIGYQSFGVLPLLKAMHALEDALSPRGATVDWVEQSSGMQLAEALASGALDLGVVGESPPVFAQAAWAPLVYLAAEPPAPEGEAVVVLDSSPIRTLADLRGRSLAMTRGANVVYFVVRALEEIGMSLADIHVKTLAPEHARAAFASGEIDAWAVWNPMLASLQQAPTTRVVRDARGLASNRAFYVGRRAFADTHPELVDAFLGQVGAVGRWANERRVDAALALAPQVGMPASAIELALARTPFDTRPIDREVVDAQQQIADTFHRLDLIVRPLQVADAVWVRPNITRRSA
jgi:aliphatic sulfonates family ABC transporter substrate-binding protein